MVHEPRCKTLIEPVHADSNHTRDRKTFFRTSSAKDLIVLSGYTFFYQVITHRGMRTRVKSDAANKIARGAGAAHK